MKKTVLAMIMVAVMPTLAGCAAMGRVEQCRPIASDPITWAGDLVALPFCAILDTRGLKQ